MKINQDKELAKAIVVEIIRQAGGTLENKTNLYKAFYHSHLWFARKNTGYLSNWPIVRMPNGPGIDNFDNLLGELIAEGFLKTQQVKKGGRSAFKFVASKKQLSPGLLPEGAVDAIREGVAEVKGKTAAQVSDASHNRAWRAAPNGGEMNIYADLLTEEEHAHLVGEFRKASKVVDEIWGN